MDFTELQNEKANELTDRIMQRLGELWLNKQVGSQGGLGDYSIGGPSMFGPRDDIRLVIYNWLIEEKPDG